MLVVSQPSDAGALMRTASCRSARSSRPPRPRPVVLRGAHREVLAGPRSSRQLAQRREQRAAALGVARERRHRHQARDGHRRARDERVELLRRDARLALLPADVDLDQDAQARTGEPRWRASSRSAESEATEWIRRTCGTIRRTRLLCSCADEVPLEQLAVRCHLGLQVLGAVLADEARRPPRRASAGPRGDVLGRGENLHLPPARSRARRDDRARGRRDLLAHAPRGSRGSLSARRSAISSATRLPPGALRARLRDGARRSARRRSCTARVAHAAHTGREQPLARDRLEVDPPTVADGLRRRRRAPPRRPRSSTRRRRDRSPRRSVAAAELAQRPHPLLEHARGEAAPAGVEHRDRPVAAERDRQAVGASAPSPRPRAAAVA